MSEPLAAPVVRPPDAVGRTLFFLSRLFAGVGGLVLLSVALMSVGSIASRVFRGTSLLGDFELVQIGAAIAIASFLPWGQMRGTHVFVDFFTTRASPAARRWLDAVGALLLALCAALVAWRMALGTIGLKDSGETTMLLAVPVWYAYALMTPSFALLAATGLYAAWRKLQGDRA